MSVLADRVLRTIRRHHLMPAGGRVIAGVSGGADSVALAHVLHELQRAGRFTLAGLAHLNHQLRGEAADADERFCLGVAARLGVPIDVEKADVRRLASEWDASLEAAGRRARYEFLGRAAARLGAERIAVGHTRNDQAETFLLRLLRGAGPGGLGGIRPRLGAVVRPLLDATRSEVVAYLREQGLDWRHDPSNADVSIPRNRVRHELIPFLEERFTPGVVDVLARDAAIARDDAEWLDRAAIETASAVVLRSEGGPGQSVRLDAIRLESTPLPLARRIVRDALRTIGAADHAEERGKAAEHAEGRGETAEHAAERGRAAEHAEGRGAGVRVRFAGFEHVDAVLALEDGQAVDLPGVRAARAGADIVIERAGSRGPRRARGTRQRGAVRGTRPEARGTNGFHYPLSIPGEVRVPEAGWAISAERMEGAVHVDGDAVLVRADALGSELAVRSRRPGDAFRPLGLGGRKKLQDFFVDRKVARAERDRVPIVVDSRDRIVWVVGQTVAEDFRVTEPAAGVILLKARRLGGLG